ncbi:hypothetical protein K501DRAFT_19620 [Backusella circina FSU 941]|nr:hypothetical protein K501DRAFT_19620 [Backusella circina FSU 941]
MTLDQTDSLRRDLLHSNFERMREITEDESDSAFLLAPSPSAPTLTDKRKVAISESRSTGTNNSSNKKRNSNNSNSNNNKKSTHTNASPAEVFHRNLVDAVSNVDGIDSDENEHYVYPYSGNETDLNRPLSVRSTPLYENDKKKKPTNWFQALTNHPSSKLKEYIKENDRKHKRFYPPPRKRQQQRYQDGYTSDDEEMPLVIKRQQARKSRNSKNTW